MYGMKVASKQASDRRIMNRDGVRRPMKSKYLMEECDEY